MKQIMKQLWLTGSQSIIKETCMANLKNVSYTHYKPISKTNNELRSYSGSKILYGSNIWKWTYSYSCFPYK